LCPPHRTREKLKYLAGSEALGGAFMMDALPEETAARLRAALEGTAWHADRTDEQPE
jgi:galactose-1-phosphate uridylyltransferase